MSSLGPPHDQACCHDPAIHPPAAQKATIRSASTHWQIMDVLQDFCLNCGFSVGDQHGNRLELYPPQLQEWKKRWDTRLFARKQVGSHIDVNTTSTSFPNPFWLPPFGLCRTITPSVLLDYHTKTPDILQNELRELFGLNDSKQGLPLATVLENEIIVDALYFQHVFEENRVDDDHISFASLIPSTLTEPLEVWQRQPGGVRTRKTVFLGVYQIDTAIVYHVVVANKSNKILTAYRLNGGKKAFENQRYGLLLYARY